VQRVANRAPAALTLEGQLEELGEQAREQHRQWQHQRGQYEEHRHALRHPACHEPVVHRDDDRRVCQVEAVRERAEAAQRAAVEHVHGRPRAAGGDRGEQAGDGRPEGQVDPE
jgi:hypothetical protein